MKIKKILFMVIFVLFFVPVIVKGEAPEITAFSGIVIDCIDGRILYEKNSSERIYPASMTKVLTAILVVENCNMEDEVVISKNAITQVESGYLTANIKEGEVLIVEQLLNLLLISSYNDVANALAEHVGGSIDGFIVMMNNKAKEIGCVNSNFVNPNGAHNVKHYSTAYDMALIGKYAMQYAEIRDIVDTIYYELGATNKYNAADRLYQTTNEMILRGSSNYYKYAKGIKTGFTTPAGNCLMSYAEKNDLPLVSVITKATTSDSRYSDTKQILEYAYENNEIKTIVEAGVTLQTANIKNATKDTKKLRIVTENKIIAVLNKTTAISSIEPKIELTSNLKAPIKKGEVLGKVIYEAQGKKYETNLIAAENVEKTKLFLVFGLTFIGFILLIGGLRILELYSKTKRLNKIRGK